MLDSFDLNAPATVDVTLTSRVYDMYVSVWNSDFLQIEDKNVYYASENNPKTGTIQLSLEPGTYYIKCTPSGSNTGRYQLKWTYAPTLVTSVSILGNKTLEAGKTLQLSTSIMPSNASNKSIKWISGNTRVATVDANTGRVKGITAGSATITAYALDDSGVQASITVIVSPKKMSKPKVKALGKKKVRIRWSTQEGASQYQVQYSKKSSFKNAKTLSYSSYYSNVTPTLKKGTYYFRIRTVANVNGSTLKGKWSKSTKVKVK